MTTFCRRAPATALALLSLAVAALGGASPASAAGPSCADLTPYAQAAFSHPTQIDSRWLPLKPGTRRVYTGTVQNDQGQTEPHTVTFTVTDVTKVIQGVKTLAVWDVDSAPTGIQESELSLWAQDDAGFVWSMGEYPEEYDAAGTFVGAPSTWLAGYQGATPGVHMAPSPVVSSTFYSQGYSSTIEFEDCARVTKIGQNQVCVPAGSQTCYDDVVTVEEQDAFDPASGFQIKAHAPGVGIVKISAKSDPLAETLDLASLGQISPAELEAARTKALELDTRAYTYGGPWNETAHAEGPPVPPPVQQPPVVQQPIVQQPIVQQPRQTVATVRVRSLSATRAKAAVRGALRLRLRGWKIVRLNCRVASRTRANCSFVATTPRGSRAGGAGVVTMHGGEGLVRFRLRARVVKGGCHPVASSRCTRRSVWKSR